MLCAILLASAAEAADLRPIPTRERRVVVRWSLSGDPRALAFGPDGTLYVGLRATQSVVAIDRTSGTILRDVVIDHEEIASTKDFATLRIDPRLERLVIAQGTDESVTILSIPDLGIVREILMEGEVIRDAHPDPAGRYLFILGRGVHVWDAAGQQRLRTFSEIDAFAIAVSSDGSRLAIVGAEQFESGSATVVSLIDTATLDEVRRMPLQTDRPIEAALFGAGDVSLLVLARDWLAEKPLAAPGQRTMVPEQRGMRVRLETGDFVSTESICLPRESGPQVAAAGPGGATVFFAERRCSVSGSTLGAPRRIRTASLYGVEAYALAYDENGNFLAASEPDGILTIYRAPKPESR
ncbi:MAG TPA: hypothetical protein VMS56_12400 [Thermoanaerobaculia bacterium]|nr:hypothetical protein [Thermoanaerobaculia bacterium]